MNSLISTDTTMALPGWMVSDGPAMGLGADQTPDEGAELFVRDLLHEWLEVDTRGWDPTWIPLGLMGTLDWIMLCNWWAWFYTGIFQSEEAYKWVFRYFSINPKTKEPQIYEFEPDQLVLFREDREQNAFEERINNPGLTDRERGQIVQFLIRDVYRAMGQEPPPQEVVEMIAYATFIWVLSDNGRDWLCEIDPVWDCVDEFKVAYLERFENTLLDPRNMEKTDRELGTCVFCKEQLYCVQAAATFDDWQSICNDCLVALHEQSPEAVDVKDRRIVKPLCGFRGGNCLNTACPHNPITHDDLGDMMARAGGERVDAWRSARIAGGEPRKLAGRTADQVVDYFRDVNYAEVLQTIDDEFIAPGLEYEKAEECLHSFIGDPNVRDFNLLRKAHDMLIQVYEDLEQYEEAEEVRTLKAQLRRQR